LAEFVELAITQRLNLAVLRRDPLDKERQQCASRLQAVLNSLSVKLRLSPSSVLQKKDGRLTESEVDTSEGGSKVLLFGGSGPTRF
jgi:hypothetical protein